MPQLHLPPELCSRAPCRPSGDLKREGPQARAMARAAGKSRGGRGKREGRGEGQLSPPALTYMSSRPVYLGKRRRGHQTQIQEGRAGRGSPAIVVEGPAAGAPDPDSGGLARI